MPNIKMIQPMELPDFIRRNFAILAHTLSQADIEIGPRYEAASHRTLRSVTLTAVCVARSSSPNSCWLLVGVERRVMCLKLSCCLKVIPHNMKMCKITCWWQKFLLEAFIEQIDPGTVHGLVRRARNRYMNFPKFAQIAMVSDCYAFCVILP